MKHDIRSIDKTIISTMRSFSEPFARAALAVLFIWFGILKVLGLSPATPLVLELFQKTLSFMQFDVFIVLFGLFEVVIGVLFLIPKAGRVAVLLLALHMITTILPLILLPHTAWNEFLVPTLEGQYIIKNIALVALAVGVVAHFHPLKKKLL